MKVAITGGKGFIGSHLPKSWKRIEKDVRYLALDDLVSFDVVVHLAALTNVEESFRCPATYFDSNVIGTWNLISRAINVGTVKKIVFTSCVGCKYNITMSPYTFTKFIGEELCKYRLNSIDTIILRLHNVYGNGCRGVVSNFVESKKEGKMAYIEGSGLQTRDFIYIEDVVKDIKYAIKRGKSGEIYEIGTGKEVTILELANMVGVIYGYKEGRINEITNVKADINNTTKDLEWKPKIKLENGIKKMLECKK